MIASDKLTIDPCVSVSSLQNPTLDLLLRSWCNAEWSMSRLNDLVCKEGAVWRKSPLFASGQDDVRW